MQPLWELEYFSVANPKASLELEYRLQSARLLRVVTEGDLKDWALRGRVWEEPGGTSEVEQDLGMESGVDWGVSECPFWMVWALITVLRLTQSVSMVEGRVSLEGLELMELMPLVVVSVLKLWLRLLNWAPLPPSSARRS